MTAACCKRSPILFTHHPYTTATSATLTLPEQAPPISPLTYKSAPRCGVQQERGRNNNRGTTRQDTRLHIYLVIKSELLMLVTFLSRRGMLFVFLIMWDMTGASGRFTNAVFG